MSERPLAELRAAEQAANEAAPLDVNPEVAIAILRDRENPQAVSVRVGSTVITATRRADFVRLANALLDASRALPSGSSQDRSRR